MIGDRRRFNHFATVITSDLFHGEVVREMQLAGLGLRKTTYAPGLAIADHAHKLTFFALVLRGAFTERSAGEIVECRPASFLFRAAHDTHANRFHAAGADCFRVELDANWISRVGAQAFRLSSSTHSQGGAASALAQRVYREFNQVDECSSLIIEALVLETLGNIVRAKLQGRRGRPPVWLNRARDLLRDAYAQPFDVPGISRTVGVHPVHLSRMFRRHFGCTMGTYLRKVRIEHACAALSRSDQSLAQIAFATGFSAQSHFSVAFKRVVGVTPAAYRRAVHTP